MKAPRSRLRTRIAQRVVARRNNLTLKQEQAIVLVLAGMMALGALLVGIAPLVGLLTK